MGEDDLPFADDDAVEELEEVEPIVLHDTVSVDVERDLLQEENDPRATSAVNLEQLESDGEVRIVRGQIATPPPPPPPTGDLARPVPTAPAYVATAVVPSAPLVSGPPIVAGAPVIVADGTRRPVPRTDSKFKPKLLNRPIVEKDKRH